MTKNKFYPVIFIFLAVLLCASVSPGKAAQVSSTPQPDDAVNTEALLTLRENMRYGNSPSMAIPGEPARQGANLLKSGIESMEDWTRLAYQAWVDENYEIVVANGGGGNPVRLTNEASQDTRP